MNTRNQVLSLLLVCLMAIPVTMALNSGPEGGSPAPREIHHQWSTNWTDGWNLFSFPYPNMTLNSTDMTNASNLCTAINYPDTEVVTMIGGTSYTYIYGSGGDAINFTTGIGLNIWLNDNYTANFTYTDGYANDTVFIPTGWTLLGVGWEHSSTAQSYVDMDGNLTTVVTLSLSGHYDSYIKNVSPTDKNFAVNLSKAYYVYSRDDTSVLWNSNHTEWQATSTGAGATITVAAYNSLHKERADIVCPGASDQEYLNYAFNALPATGGSLELMDGTYNLSVSAGPIIIPHSYDTLEGQGNSTLLNLQNEHISDPSPDIIYADGLDHITIKNLRAFGDLYNGDWAHGCGIHFHAVTNSRIENCTLEQAYKANIWFASTMGTSVTSCNINGVYAGHPSSGYGILFQSLPGEIASQYNDVSDTRINSCGVGVYIEGNYDRFTDVVFGQNDQAVKIMGGLVNPSATNSWVMLFTNCEFCYSDVDPDVYLEEVENCQFENCDFRANFAGGLGIAGCTNIKVDNCIFRQNNMIPPYGVYSDIKFSDTRSGVGVCKNCVVSNCVFSPKEMAIGHDTKYAIEFTNAAHWNNSLLRNKYNSYNATSVIKWGAGMLNTNVDFWSTDFLGGDWANPGVSTTGGIQEAVNNLPPCGGRIFIPAGNFIMSKQIDMSGLSNINLEGAGTSTILSLPNHTGSLLTATANSGQPDVTVADASGFSVGMYVTLVASDYRASFTIDGITGNVVTLNGNLTESYTTGHSAKLWQDYPAILVTGSTYCTIDNLSVAGNKANQIVYNGTFADGVSISPNDYQQDCGIFIDASSNYCIVKDCSIDSIVGHSIWARNSDNVTISGCTISNSGDCGVVFSGSTDTSAKDLIDSNRVTTTGATANRTASASAYGHGLSLSSEVYFSNVTGNVVCSTKGAGIYSLSDLVTISGNYLSGDATDYAHNGASLYASGDQIIVDGNTIDHSASGGIWGFKIQGEFADNTIYYTAHFAGLRMDNGSAYAVVSGNHIYGAYYQGMDIGGSYQTIANNYIEAASQFGNNVFSSISTNGTHITITDNTSRAGALSNKPAYGIYFDNPPPTDVYIHGNKIDSAHVSGLINNTNVVGIYPNVTQSIQCYLAYGTDNVLGVTANGTVSATTQPDVARNLTVTLTKGTGNGAGIITITGKDIFGNAVSDSKTWTAGAGSTVALTKILASIDTSGITISGLSGTDKISVGVGNTLGLSAKIFTGAVSKVTKSGVGNYTNYTVDATYMAVIMGDNIASNDTFQITYLDCLA